MPDGPMTATEAGRIAALPAVDVLRLFRSKALAPSEYLGVLLDRIAADARHEQPLNAFMEVLDGPAREQARAADTFYARHGNDGTLGAVLMGLPVATKEKHALAGHSHSQGMRAHAGAVAGEDHPAVARIRAAGGLVHGRTTSPEFSCATVTHSRMWGVTRNPWNRALSPGGSSGGAAAALAAGMTPLATASDIAGSTRLPAAFTGNVGYKGPYGTVPGAGPFAADWYRGDGAMARTVADTALLTDVMRGPHPSDHATVPSRGIAVATEEQALSTLQGRRLAYSPTLGNHPVERGVLREVERAVTALEAAGADVVEVDLPWTTEELSEVGMAHFGHLLAEGMRSLLAGQEHTAEAYTLRFIEAAREHAARRTLYETVAAEHRIQADLATALRGVDALLTPASAVRALAADGQYLDGITVTDQPDGADRTLEHYWQAHMAVPFNIANRCPVLCVPAGAAAAGATGAVEAGAAGAAPGFPVGLQIVGHSFDETTVFEIGQAVESLARRRGQ
ncbi:amidase [Nocardiopsis salina]|uniref:amidase n=1 Tax=Nocardiopsis salina TaxID=245836 RepID=UPI000346BAB4|nr:amidase [Nocardiopsis salina]